MPPNHLILCHPLLLLPSIVPSIRSFPMSQFFTSDGQRIGASAPIYKIVSSLKTGCFPSQTVCIFKDWGLKHEWQGTLMFQTEMLSHLCAIAFKQQLMVDVVDNGRGFCVCVCVCVCVWERNACRFMGMNLFTSCKVKGPSTLSEWSL